MSPGSTHASSTRLRALHDDLDGTPPDPRFSLANERTFLAWNRTALALIGGGLAAAQLLRFGLSGAHLLICLPLIALGATVGTAGIRRWRSCELAIATAGHCHLPAPRQSCL